LYASLRSPLPPHRVCARTVQIASPNSLRSDEHEEKVRALLGVSHRMRTLRISFLLSCPTQCYAAGCCRSGRQRSSTLAESCSFPKRRICRGWSTAWHLPGAPYGHYHQAPPSRPALLESAARLRSALAPRPSRPPRAFGRNSGCRRGRVVRHARLQLHEYVGFTSGSAHHPESASGSSLGQSTHRI
jgi:hypothetical protein